MIERSIEVEARLDSLRTIGRWLADAARDGGLSYEVAFGLDLAAHEAVENVVRHGYGDGGDYRIRLRFRSDDRRAEVVVEDDAPAFDPLSIPPPAAPQRLEDVVPGGQGIHLIRHFTDEMHYRREGGRNVLTFARILAPPGGATGPDPLAASLYFEGVPPETLGALREAGRVVPLEAGEILLSPGETNRALHFVLAGTLEVRLEAAGGFVGRVGPGECLGEMSVVDGAPVSAWVVADGPCKVLSVPEEKLWAELLHQPGFARGLLRLLTGRLRQVLERQAAFELVRKELGLAREIQASMLPGRGVLFPDRPEVDCAAAMEPAAEVGGDFYDAFFLDERRLFFAVGDVAGKGIAAALFMARALTLLRAEALRRRPLHETLGRVNESLAEGNEQATFVALTCGVLDTWSGGLRYANGGGGAPLVRAGGRWSRLPMPRGIVVGAIPGSAFESARARLAPGDAIVLFSDGVTEATSPAGELFGLARLTAAVEATGAVPAFALVEAIRGAVAAFAGGGRPADDLTLLVVVRPPSEARTPSPAGPAART